MKFSNIVDVCLLLRKHYEKMAAKSFCSKPEGRFVKLSNMVDVCLLLRQVLVR